MARMTRRPVNAAPAEDYDESTVEDTPQDAAPRRTARRVQSSGPIQSGWGAPAQQRRETVKAPYLTVSTQKTLIKILEDTPAVRYEQHYIKSLNRYFTCTSTEDELCPLCSVDHNPSRKFMMNVVVMPAAKSKEAPVVSTWSFGPQVAQLIQEHVADEPKYPLTGENTYFFVWRVKGANDRWENRLKLVKGRDLIDDYDTVPLTEVELDELSENLYGEETVFIPSEKMLREAANGYAAYSRKSDD